MTVINLLGGLLMILGWVLAYNAGAAIGLSEAHGWPMLAVSVLFAGLGGYLLVS